MDLAAKRRRYRYWPAKLGSGRQRSGAAGCRGDGCRCPHMIPLRPLAQIGGPIAGSLGRLWLQAGEPLIPGNVARRRDAKRTAQLQKAGGQEQRRAQRAPRLEGENQASDREQRGAHEDAEEKRIQDNCINALHGRDALVGGKLGERLHDERGEGIEHTADDTGAYAGEQG